MRGFLNTHYCKNSEVCVPMESITTIPKEKLTIYIKSGEESIIAFRVFNKSDNTLACMVNSNNKELYVVKPTRFVLAPGKDKLVSLRCDKNTVDDLLEADLPTKNRLQIVAYKLNKTIENSLAKESDKPEKDALKDQWPAIQACPSTTKYLNVRFTTNPADVTYSTCVSPGGEEEDCISSCVSHVSFTHRSLIACIVVAGMAMLISYIYKSW
ncbi:hypothetical protein WA577_003142, partial [Blastocystis sp. JDR]